MPGMPEQADSGGGSSVRCGQGCPDEASLGGCALPPATVILTPEYLVVAV